ncbi:hypothetical protein [Gimesia panareensis]|uniref:Uncharacterized protein n=1 Tax=Gimesia panareensis TaxID=2527978 RepID=A0A517QE98_9PLAN|nr:hypothetical protein [Gimesia panareensis]QDT29951.1 hypothetical protein Enr10x_53090 [Gimesia panareensis]QDU53034.1 hypothetical protein Pan110_54170 [Gimesia panareensis]
MKPMKLKLKKQQDTRQHPPRRGSTLLVVIALLAMLSLLGVVFYTFASQEERSAQYFTEASLNEADPGLDADVLFNWGLEQLIKGPEQGLYNSALYTGRHSLLPNMFGSDLHPFTGQGVNVTFNSSNVLIVDQNYDGVEEAANASFKNLNLSPGAYASGSYPNVSNFPEPDAGYTAPDINSLFLAYDGYTLTGGNWRRVVIPSFLRPQHLRNTSTGIHLDDWYSNSATPSMVLRPHPDHAFVDTGGNPTGTLRFTNSFPFTPLSNPGGNGAVNGELGIFTNSFNSGAPVVELDVDNDNDGLVEGIWMDLDFPPIQNPSDPTKYILPLFSFTVYDLDGLVNLNTAGNMRRPGDINLNYNSSNNFFGEHGATNKYTDKYLLLSRSNMGLSSPGEINPQWVLNARPEVEGAGGTGGDLKSSASPAAVFQQHRIFFGDYPYPYGAIGAPRSYASYTMSSDFRTAYESTRDWREISNMEYFFLNFGRPEFSAPSPLNYGTKSDVIDLYAGRWGEPNRLYDALRDTTSDSIYIVDASGSPVVAFPRAGQTLVDDNANRYEGGIYAGSLTGNRGNTQSFLHPLAYNGSGRNNKTGANYRLANIGYNGWKGYEDFEIAGAIRYNGGNTFFKNSVADTSANFGVLMDDADEITVDLEKVQRPYDEPFTPDDLAFLHMNQTDQDDTGVTSRLEDLLPFNFGRAATVNKRGDQIRKKFTTMSWDRKQFALSEAIITRIMNNGSSLNLDTSSRYASWLFSADTNQDGKLEFPPDFANERDLDQNGNLNYSNFYSTLIGTNIEDLNGDGTRQTTSIAGTALDPFRSAVRNLLTVEKGNTSTARLQMRLNLNELVVFDSTGTGRVVTTRPLTPHPGEDVNGNGTLDVAAGEDLNGNNVLDTLPATTINSSWYSFNLPSYPPTSPQQQEFWARYDRQRMARDIYVLLYTLGGSKDNLDYRSSNLTNALYTDAQLKEMAQFAVNVVDALDPDDVITRFEYDKNLNDGWGLGDNPYQTSDETTLASGLGISSQATQRGVVHGVEAQKLTLSEFLAIKAPKVEDSSNNPVNHDATQYDDKKDRYFSFIELRNAGTRTVSFANDAWQIRLEPRVDAVEDTNSVTNSDYVNLDSLLVDGTLNDTHKRRVTLRSGAVGGGGIYTVRSAGDNENTDPMTGMPRPSYFRVDPNFSGGSPTYSTIAPQDITAPATDLITDDDTADFRMTTEADIVTPIANRGDFLNGSNTDAGSTNPSDLKFVVRLMRRAHLGRAAPAPNTADDDDNPWVEVDSMVVLGMKQFSLQQSDMSTQIQNQLNPLQSFEREQPFYSRGAGEVNHAAGTSGSSYRANTVGTTNSNTGTGSVGVDGAPGIVSFDDDNSGSPDDSTERGWAFSDDRPRFDIWQPHFDRDFASVVELFSIPVVGPNRVTRDLATESGWQTRTDTTTSVARGNDVRFAGIQKFLDPSGPDDTDSSTPAPNCDDNRWYRLLEFVEVPTRAHLQLGNPLNDPRVPGRINLNTVRHPSVLAALLDDSDAFTLDLATNYRNPPLTAPHLGGGNWWTQFLQSRDAADPVITNNPRIPGTPGSRPFRSLHQNQSTSLNGLRENSIFRSLPADSGSNNPRLLFEVATGAEHIGTAGAANKVDFYTRNRLLSKITANTTTRSNTFIVFISVAYFEATGAGTTTYGSPVQIGARLSPIDPARTANQADYRGFFVIDRTRAEQAFEPSTGKFDHWKNLIRFRHTIQQ